MSSATGSTGMPVIPDRILTLDRAHSIRSNERGRGGACLVDQDGSLAQSLVGLEHRSIFQGEHGQAAQAQLHQFQCLDEPIVHSAETRCRGTRPCRSRFAPLSGDRAGSRSTTPRARGVEDAPVEKVDADADFPAGIFMLSNSTWRMIWLGSSCGWAWNFRPIQPWHSLFPL